MQVPKAILQEKRVAVNTPVFDESVIVDTLLNDENDDILDLPPLIEAGSPTLSKVNMSDITTFLARTGYQQVKYIVLQDLLVVIEILGLRIRH